MKHNAEFQRLAQQAGIVFMAPGGGHLAMDYMPEGVLHNFGMACDAQPGLVTASNSGIPSYLSNYMDPNVIKVLLAPMRAAEIIGESQKGDWVTDTATFPIVELTGEVSSYGDFSENGSAGANANFNTRQSYHYQVFTEWGEKELAKADQAKLQWASQLNSASALALNKFQNKSYFFGIAGIKCYGLINDPALPASIAPTQSWATATAEQIYEDVRRLYKQLQIQLNGNLDEDAKLTLVMSPAKKTDLNKTNTYNVNVYTLIKGNFPNIEVKTAPEYTLAGGEFVQLIVDGVDGQQTATAAFTEKMRAHPIVIGSSSYRQKKSQGTWGTIVFRPVCIASMLGV